MLDGELSDMEISSGDRIQMIYIVPDKIILLQNQRKRSGEPSGIMCTLMQKWYIIMWHQRHFKGWNCPAVVLGKDVQFWVEL